MTYKKVYRIENRDGWGPYWAGPSDRNWQDWDHNADAIGHPNISNDRGFSEDTQDIYYGAEPGRFLCGFRDLKQLRRWFTRREQAKLAKLGFRVVKVEPSWVRHGRKQSIFIRKEVCHA